MFVRRSAWHRAGCLALVGLLVGSLARPAFSGGVFQSRAVGGVMISAEGLLENPDVETRKKLYLARTKALESVPGDMDSFSKMRKVSLRGLEAAIARQRTDPAQKMRPLPQDVVFLAGLQRIDYVFVYPELNDVVLVGPAEGWKIDRLGNVVGKTTGQPVMLLDDLMIALRSARQRVIDCSIEPTNEGLQNLRTLAGKLTTIGNPRTTTARIEQALGEQIIRVGGVEPDTHFARVMVAADYKMKRYAMHFEKAPVKGLPSFLEMTRASSRGLHNMLPRWWLAPKSEPLLTDPEGLSWQLRGMGVQCKTEEDFLQADGSRKRSGQASATARLWAEKFTEKYEELSRQDTVFGQLRNLMDLVVVAALIEREGMLDRAGLKLTYLTGEELTHTHNPPRRVASQASVLKKGRNWLISASGGVQIFPSELVASSQRDEKLKPLRSTASATTLNWWWD